MKLSLSWLNEYLDRPLNLAEAEAALGRTTIEIEEVGFGGNFDTKIVVGLVKSVTKHGDANKLFICEIEDGTKSYQVVTGAANIKAGQKVPFAKAGATLPTGQLITAGKFRGEKSEGMLCSADELGLGDDHTGIYVLADTAAVGQELSSVLGGEAILDLKTPPNRPDLNAVVGIAREVAVHAERKLKLELPLPLSLQGDEAKVKIMASSAATGYLAAWMDLSGSLPATPGWMVERLSSSGLRSLNLLVDITNYVMLEWGQPLHAFDADKIQGQVKVRLAEAGETLTTLDGVKRALTKDDLVIADDSGAVALAGVMGGEATEVGDKTKRVMLEAATFDGPTVRKTALRLGLRTEASARFERNLRGEWAKVGLERAVELLQELAGAKFDVGIGSSQKSSQEPVQLTLKQASNYLGVELNSQEAVNYFEALGFKADDSKGDEMVITSPWWRPDVSLSEDLIEELAKMVGFDKIPAVLPPLTLSNLEVDRWWQRLFELKEILRGAGLFELNTYAFLGADDITKTSGDVKEHLELANPRSGEQRYLRRDLLASLLKTVSTNLNYAKDFGCFEVSRVFLSRGASSLPDEPLRLAVICRTEGSGYRAVKAVIDIVATQLNIKLAFVPAKGERFFPGKLADIKLGSDKLGGVGEVHPGLLRRWKIDQSIGYLEIDLMPLLQHPSLIKAQPVAKFPAATRDLTVAVGRNVLWQDVEQEIGSVGLAEVAFLSDYYGKELADDKKTLAMRLTMRSDSGTLTDGEADERLQQIVTLLEKSFQAKVR